MEKETIIKKLERLKELLKQLREWLLEHPNFEQNLPLLRASERNFELIVEQATDINGIILGELGKPIPDTYKGSFIDMGKAKIFAEEFMPKFLEMVDLRNRMVHDYNFNEEFPVFYSDLSRQIATLDGYVKIISEFYKTMPD